jgi:hypothetical protein
MKYPFTIQTASNNEWSEPQLIKNNIDGCVHDSFLPTLICIESWSCGDKKKCSVEIEIICGNSIETGESITTIISLMKGSISTAKANLTGHSNEHSVWIKIKGMNNEIVNLSGHVEIYDPENMPVAHYEGIAGRIEK